MSLIQEALKRQQKEYGDGTPPEAPSSTFSESPVTETIPLVEKPASTVEMPVPTVQTPTSFPAVPPPAPLMSRHWSKPGMMIGGIVATALVVLVGGMIFAKWALKVAQKKAILTVVAPPVIPRPGAVVPMPGSGLDKTQGTEPSAQPAISRPEFLSPTAALPKLSSSPASVPPSPPMTASKELLSPKPQDSETADRTASPPAGKPSVEKAPPAPVQWPSLKLTAILASPNSGEGTARINNQMMFVGGQISGVTLVEIRSEGVLLKYGKETRFLKMGGVLY